MVCGDFEISHPKPGAEGTRPWMIEYQINENKIKQFIN
jgi:hypothetical protein